MRMLKNLIRFLLIGSCLWAASCSSREDAASTNQQERPAIAAAVQAHDFAPGQLEAHYQKHGDQFGGITREQYLAKARPGLHLDAKPVGWDLQQQLNDLDCEAKRKRPSS